jgi:hypothetical protein
LKKGQYLVGICGRGCVTVTVTAAVKSRPVADTDRQTASSRDLALDAAS